MIPEDLPGADLVSKGLDEARRGEETIEALLVWIGAPRLRGLGIVVPAWPFADPPEMRLFERLAEEDEVSAHSRYNALIRRLVSCERALERESSRRGGQRTEGSVPSPSDT